MDVINDIVVTWKVIAGSLVTAFLLGFVFMIVLRFFGGPLIWGSILLILSGSGYGGYELWKYGEALQEEDS